MFATLLGALPMPPSAGEDGEAGEPAEAGEAGEERGISAAIEAAIRAQEAAGLEPITDGRLGDPDLRALARALLAEPGGQPAVERWRRAARLTDNAVKQALPGPIALGRALGLRDDDDAGVADALRREVDALAAAGCALVEIEEANPDALGDDVDAWRRFAEAHARLAGGIHGTHVSLSIVGGSVPEAGRTAVAALPYASLAVDLIAGPDNWHVARQWPGDRGLIVGALSANTEGEAKELLLWAAHYAAAGRGRGIARVGLGSAGSWANLTWVAAADRVRRLGEAAALAAQPPSEEVVRQLDPRAVSSRRAALGHGAGPRPRRTPPSRQGR